MYSRLLLALLCASLLACQGEHTSRKMGFEVEGIDVSRYQTEVDWDLVASQGFDFAYMKATEGATHIDAKFCDNWAATEGDEIVRGAYHFFRANTDAREQADHYFANASLSIGDLPPVLDVESTDGVDKAALITGIRTWLYLAEIRSGVKPIIYTNLSFYYHHLAGHFDDYTFWVARYGNKQPSISTGAHLAFWQYGQRGEIAGIDGFVDLNVFFGSEAEFNALRIQEPTEMTSSLSL